MRALYRTLAIAAVLAISVPSGLDSCGIAPPIPVFATSQRPADLKQFVAGNVGVLQRSYHPRYLIGGFRILSGIRLTQTEIESIFAVPPYTGVPPAGTPYQDMWNAARAAVSSLGPAVRAIAYKTVTAKGSIYSYQNCYEDAFFNATKTLWELSREWGAEDPKTLDWVRAQDEVFANCSSNEPMIPTTPQANAVPLFAAYRRYQIAAALFYSGQYREASEAFQQIAMDDESPWRGYGPYLAARALVRAGMFDSDQDALREGEARLLAISKNPGQSEWRESSLNLLHLAQIRVEPRARLAELSRALMKPSDDDDVSQSVIDFLALVYRRSDAGGRPWTGNELTEIENSDELAAWLLSMSSKPPADSGVLSVAWWRKTHNPAWLISALLGASANDLPELLAAARQVPPAAPAYESVAYYAISREIVQGHAEEARAWADQALSHNLLLSSRNLILARSISLARNWNEFLYFSLRKPEPHIVKLEGHEVDSGTTPGAVGTAPVFDGDVIGLFNYVAPLSAWLDAGGNARLPASIQLRIAEAGWFRAVLLGRNADARTLMDRVVKLQPASATAVAGYLSARDPEEAGFAAVYLILRAPALRPALLASQYETVNFAEARNVATDAYGHRVGCWSDGWVRGMHLPSPGIAGFLTASQRDAGEAEAVKILGAEHWEATYLARQTLAWARKHPDDLRIPEALHRAVMAAYYRCGDARTGEYSKQAFDLLHRQYPNSPWAARTPYWYK